MLQQIDHVNLVVSDLEKMVSFYCGVLGLRVSKRVTIRGPWIDSVVGLKGVDADVVYLDLEQGPRIELIHYRSPEPPPRDTAAGLSNAPGLRHMAFKVDDIDGLVKTLGAAGVRFFGSVQNVPESQVKYAGGARKQLIYFHDPEGNLLELCEYK